VLTIYHQANDHHPILKTRPLVLDASPFIEFEFSINSRWTDKIMDKIMDTHFSRLENHGHPFFPTSDDFGLWVSTISFMGVRDLTFEAQLVFSIVTLAAAASPSGSSSQWSAASPGIMTVWDWPSTVML